jgi:tetratricopeptide (TPR) repeat protein
MTITVAINLVIAVGVGFLAFFLVKNIILPHRAAAAAGLLKKNKNLQAINAGKKAVEKDPKNAEAHYNLGRAYLSENRDEQALREFISVNRLGVGGNNIPETEFHQTFARLLIMFNQKEEALKEYLVLIKSHPENPEYYFQAGMLFSDRNRGDRAEEYLKKALSLNTKEPKYYTELGALLAMGKRNHEAEVTLEAGLKIDPNNPKNYFYLGKAHKDAKDYAGAIQAYEKSSRAEEYKVRSLIEVGSCYMSLKMIDKAIPELERAVNASVNDGDGDTLYARYFLAMCFENKSEYAKAVEQWDKIYAKKRNFRDVSEKLSKYQQYRVPFKAGASGAP